jgi:hypothetical protein
MGKILKDIANVNPPGVGDSGKRRPKKDKRAMYDLDLSESDRESLKDSPDVNED